MARYAEIVPRLAAQLAERWVPDRTLDVGAAMEELAMGIIVHTLFGGDLKGEADRLRADLRALARWAPLLLTPIAQRWDGAGVPPFHHAARALERVDTAVRGCIANARPGASRDLLSLLQVRAEGGFMSPDLARDEAMTLFLAGHDTMAAALTWTWYLLAMHPDAARRLECELDEVLGNRDPDSNDCPRLIYTSKVLDEALRLYPPVGRIGRRPVTDYTIGGCRIPAGAAVFLSPYVTQRDPRWWPEPERFDPERWTDEARALRPRYAAFPFGAGPRVCIGIQMARMIGILAIATIARRWRMAPLPGPPPTIRSILTLKPRHPLRMRLQRAGLKPVTIASQNCSL